MQSEQNGPAIIGISNSQVEGLGHAHPITFFLVQVCFLGSCVTHLAETHLVETLSIDPIFVCEKMTALNAEKF